MGFSGLVSGLIESVDAGWIAFRFCWFFLVGFLADIFFVGFFCWSWNGISRGGAGQDGG